MLRQVSNGQYLDAIRMAEKFILHVEVLFGTIDDLEYHCARLNLKGMPWPHVCTYASYVTFQGCPMSAKHACFVEKPSISSRCCPVRKKQDRVG